MNVTAGVIALIITAGSLPFVIRRLVRLQRYDVPNTRSSHSRPVPRGGGVSLIGGWLAGIAGAVFFGDSVAGSARDVLLIVAASALGFGILGIAEDVRERAVGLRFSIQLLLALGASLGIVVEASSRGAFAAVLEIAVGSVFVLGLCNVTNFMDGINGISGAQALVAGGSFAIYGQTADFSPLAVGGVALAGAALGFLPFNAPKAKVFMGDSGSYFLGGAMGLLVVAGSVAGLNAITLVAPFAVYLSDTAFTMTRRLVRGERITEAHREHAYQRLVQRGWTHGRTSSMACLFMAAHSALGFVVRRSSVTGTVICAAAGLALIAIYLALPTLVAGRRTRATSSRSSPGG